MHTSPKFWGGVSCHIGNAFQCFTLRHAMLPEADPYHMRTQEVVRASHLKPTDKSVSGRLSLPPVDLSPLSAAYVLFTNILIGAGSQMRYVLFPRTCTSRKGSSRRAFRCYSTSSSELHGLDSLLDSRACDSKLRR